MFHEYPKSLYKNGDHESEHVVVKDAEEEAAKREEGFRMYGEEAKEPKRGPGPPKKAE